MGERLNFSQEKIAMNGLEALDLLAESDGTIKRQIMMGNTRFALVSDFGHGTSSYEPISFENLGEFIVFCSRLWST